MTNPISKAEQASTNKLQKCDMCDKLVKKPRVYCHEHYLDYLAAKSQQCWSVSDND